MITTCDFRLVCPLNWAEMADLPDGSGKHGAHCQRSVALLRSAEWFITPPSIT
jgi:hypothetical protein